MSERKRYAGWDSRKDGDGEEEEVTTPQIADAATLAQRKIVKVKRPAGAQSTQKDSALFKALNAAAPAPSPGAGNSSSFSADWSTVPKQTEDQDSQKKETSKPAEPTPVFTFGAPAGGFSFGAAAPVAEKKDKPEDEEKKAESSSSNPFAMTATVFGGGSGPSFEFKPSVKETTPSVVADAAANLAKAEVKEVVTGEEGDENVVSLKGKLYRKDGTEWKERGCGTLKVNKAVEGSSKPRLVMRDDATKKVSLNINIDDSFKLIKKEEKSVIFSGGVDNGIEAFFLKVLEGERSATQTEALLKALEELKPKA